MSKNTKKLEDKTIKDSSDLSLFEHAEYMQYLAWSSLQDLKNIDRETKKDMIKTINNIPIYKAKKTGRDKWVEKFL